MGSFDGCVPVEVAEAVNRIIDAGPVHDLGEVKRWRLRLGSIEVPLRPQSICEMLRAALIAAFPRYEEYVLAVKATFLHHVLDKVERLLREHGLILARDPVRLVYHAYVDRRSQLYCLRHGLGDTVFDDVYGFVERNAERMVDDIVNEAGVDVVGPGALAQLLALYVWCRGVYGVVRIPSHMGRPLPVAAAARKIYSLLKRGERVVLALDRGLEFDSLKDLVSTIIREIPRNCPD